MVALGLTLVATLLPAEALASTSAASHAGQAKAKVVRVSASCVATRGARTPRRTLVEGRVRAWARRSGPTTAQARERARAAACAEARPRALALARRKAHVRAKAEARRARERARRLWTPHNATTFNYPTARRAADRFRIRRHILQAVWASPRGSRIRLSTFTFVDDRIAAALVSAHRRGVSITVLVNRKNAQKSPSFRLLRRTLNHRTRGSGLSRAEARVVKTCTRSCRGSRGNLHSKIYLFSQVGRARWVSMVGSANLTKFAATGQWNHLDTIVAREDYRRLLTVFDEMRADRPQKRPFKVWTTRSMVAWVFPRPGTRPADDPMVRALQQVTCVSPAERRRVALALRKARHAHRVAVQRNEVLRKLGRKPVRISKVPRPHVHRTRIRINMYAWFDQRGNALAKVVRQKWNQGCDVRVIYSFDNGTVHRTLRNRADRGPVQLRRSVTFDPLGEVRDYDHSKYVAVNGLYRGKRHQLVWTGSMNFTGLGLSSDDIVVRLSGPRVYRDYAANFRRVWHARTSKRS